MMLAGETLRAGDGGTTQPCRTHASSHRTVTNANGKSDERCGAPTDDDGDIVEKLPKHSNVVPHTITCVVLAVSTGVRRTPAVCRSRLSTGVMFCGGVT